MLKYNTYVRNGKLCFVINEGQFKNVEYEYNSLTEDKGLQYKVIKNSKAINENNKLLFENDIRNILQNKLKSIKG